jgi:hypothetical protein
MRWRPAGVAVVALLFLATGTAEPHAPSAPTRAQLQLMPLPHAAYGAAAAALTVAADAGWVDNAKSAENDLDPAMTASRLARTGRVTGFDVEFSDLTKASRPGQLVEADSEVDAFRTAAGAAAYVAAEAAEFRRFAGKRIRYGTVVDRVSSFAVPGVPGAHGIRARIRAGGLSLWGTGVLFPVGALAATVGLDRTDARDVHAEVTRLAVELRRRIGGVLAGTVRDRPLAAALPKLGGLGRPPGAPTSR